MSYKDSSTASIKLIERWLDYQTYIRELPSISVGINIEGETLLRQSWGYKNLATRDTAQPDNLYRIASHSKLFTSCAIMKLFEQGRLRLDDYAKDHLDWFQSPDDPNLEHITLRQLMSHSAGMNRDGVSGHWLNDNFPHLDQIKSQTVEGLSTFDTTEHWKYSNMGYTILGQVIEAVTGQPYEAAVKELVVDPLGLCNTFPDLDDENILRHVTGYGRKLPGKERDEIEPVRARVMNSATGFSSSLDDLIAFYRCQMMGNESFLPDRLKREMQRLQFVENDIRWGLGFSMQKFSGSRFLGHGGGYPGYITYSCFCQETETIIVVLTSAIDGPAMELAAGIVDILNAASRHESKLTADTQADMPWMDDISGFYGNRWGVSLFQRLANQMVMLSPDMMPPSIGLGLCNYEGDNTFRHVEGLNNGALGESMSVVKDGDDWALQSGEGLSPKFNFSY